MTAIATETTVQPECMRADELAKFLGVNRKTVYEAVRLKQVPGVVRLGKAIRIGRAALRAWISRPSPTSPCR